MKRVKLFIFDTFMTLVVFCIVCVAGLIDIRAAQSPKNSSVIKEISLDLGKDEKEIQNMGDRIVKENKEIAELKKQMDDNKVKGNYKDWNNNVISYNSKLSEYNKDMDEYNCKLEDYNKKYNQYKLLGEKHENVFVWVKSVLGVE